MLQVITGVCTCKIRCVINGQCLCRVFSIFLQDLKYFIYHVYDYMLLISSFINVLTGWLLFKASQLGVTVGHRAYTYLYNSVTQAYTGPSMLCRLYKAKQVQSCTGMTFCRLCRYSVFPIIEIADTDSEANYTCVSNFINLLSQNVRFRTQTCYNKARTYLYV